MATARAEGKLRVAVVGGGVGGAAVAGYLARGAEVGDLPWSVVLFERRIHPDMPDGGALRLRGEALEVLAELGADLAVLAGVGHSATASDALAAGEASASPEEMYLTRDALVNLLLHHGREHIDLRGNCEIVAIRESPTSVELDHRPLLVQRDGQWARNEDAASTTEAFDLVIGADGNAPSSLVLRCVVGDAAAKAAIVPMLLIQAMVPCEADDIVPDREEYLRNGPAGVVGKLSLQTAIGRTKSEIPSLAPGGLQPWATCTVFVALADPMRRFPRREAWADIMRKNVSFCKDQEMVAKAEFLIEQADSESLGGNGVVSCGRFRAWVPFSKDSVQKWRSEGGRCVLLGDAAHLMPPTLGWGSSCALGDARAFAGALAEASPSSECWMKALDRYEATRREVASECASKSTAEARKMVGRWRE